MDICGPISTTKNGNKYILVIQCQLSRFVILVALKDQTAETIADSLIKRFLCIFGSFCCVLTDKGAAFCGKIIKIIANRFKFKKIETTAFSVWENGKVERSNWKICTYLRNFISRNTERDQILDIAQFHYNISIHSTHNYKPYKIIFGFLPRFPSLGPLKKLEQLPTINNYVQNLIDKLNEITKILTENIMAAKEKSKKKL